MFKHIVAPHKALPVVAIVSLSFLAPSQAAQPPATPTSTLANATTSGTYFRPPSNPSPRSGPRTSTGTRRGGCLGVTETAFTLLGPDAGDHVPGLTTSNRPTFAWHLPSADADFPVLFRVLAPDANDIPVPIYQTTLDYESGLTTHQLPDTVDALTTDTEYRWQVIVECNPEYPAQAIVQELSFEMVPMDGALAQALSRATTASERAVAYGQAGVWYDAFSEVAQSTTVPDEETRAGLLENLAASLPEDKEQLRQDILDIVEATDSF